MALVSISKRIEAPIDVVYDVATDLDRVAERITGIERIERLTDGPFGVGTRWRETRVMFGREDTQELEVTDCDPLHGYEVGCETCGSVSTTSFRFEPEGDATLLEMDLDCRGQSMMAKLLSPIMGILFGRMMRRLMETDLEELRQVAEAEARSIV